MKTLKFKEYKNLNEEFNDDFDPQIWKSNRQEFFDNPTYIQRRKIIDWVHRFTGKNLDLSEFDRYIEIVESSPLILNLLNFNQHQTVYIRDKFFSFEKLPFQINKLEASLEMNGTLVSNFNLFPKEISGELTLHNNAFKNFEGIDQITFDESAVIDIQEQNAQSLKGFTEKLKFNTLDLHTSNLLTFAGFNSSVEKIRIQEISTAYPPPILSFKTDNDTKIVGREYGAEVKPISKVTNRLVQTVYQLPEDVLEFHYRFLEKHFELEALNILDRAIKYAEYEISFQPDERILNIRNAKRNAETDIGFSF